MSQEIDLCRDSGDANGERPNSASLPSLPRSSKRLRDKEESRNGHVKHNVKGSAGFVVDLELEDEVEFSPHKKRRGVRKSKESGMNGAAGKCAHILIGDDATETDVDGEDSNQTTRDNGSANTNSHKLSTSKRPSNASGTLGKPV